MKFYMHDIPSGSRRELTRLEMMGELGETLFQGLIESGSLSSGQTVYECQAAVVAYTSEPAHYSA